MKYKIGSIIEYRAFDGQIRQVEVSEKHADIKNGRPGFDGWVVSTGAIVWGYDTQITRIIRL